MENGKWKMKNLGSGKYFPFYIFRFAFVLCVICLLCGPISAQKKNALGWVWQNPLPQGNPLFSIDFTKDKETGYAVGADGTILRTIDGGFNWTAQQSPVNAVISSVFTRAVSPLALTSTD